jgi:Kef-type K+ transport system membrane component KefB
VTNITEDLAGIIMFAVLSAIAAYALAGWVGVAAEWIVVPVVAFWAVCAVVLLVHPDY